MQSLRNFLFAHRLVLIYIFLLLLVITDRWLLLEHFTFRYVDDDQSIMWFGAKEFAAGGFHEPYFFGQPYNTMLESLAAVPLIKIGISYPVALTCIMNLFTLLPYFLISSLLFRRGKEIQAFIVLSIPLLLPTEFGMITAISRGCVTGIFIAGFAVMTLYSQSRIRFFLFGFLSVLALWATPSAIILLFPVGIWLWTENFRNKKFYVHTLIGAIPAAAVWYFANRFYVIHPEYVVHRAWPLDFYLTRIKPYDWNDRFNDVIPIFWNVGCLIFPILLITGIVLYRQNEKKAAIGLFAGILFLLFSLTSNKVHDGYPTVFYSWGRMFMAIPLLLALFLSQIHFPKLPVKKSAFLMLIPVLFFCVKCATLPKIVHRELVEKTEHNMYVSEISSLQTLCDKIVSVSEQNQVDLIIVGHDYRKHLINYGCPCLENKFPRAIEPSEDRRTWLLKDEDSKIRKTILFVGISEDIFATQLKLNQNLSKISDDPLIYILKNNNLQTAELLKTVQMPMRLH
jgi:hypothetical protein